MEKNLILVINEKDKMDFVGWFNDVWSNKYCFIKTNIIMSDSIHIVFNVSNHVFYQIIETLAEDTKIKYKIL